MEQRVLRKSLAIGFFLRGIGQKWELYGESMEVDLVDDVVRGGREGDLSTSLAEYQRDRPTRGRLEEVRCLQVRHLYNGRGAPQRQLCVGQYGRTRTS